MPHLIDLNADLGEGFGNWRAGDDEALLDLVTSANVACGFHAGDAATMRRTCAAAAGRGVRIGAHVGYPDLAGFGRREMGLSPAEVGDAVVYQLGALVACAASVGAGVSYVKPHGALYHRASAEEEVAAALVAAVRSVAPDLSLLAPPGSQLLRQAEAQRLPGVAEGFADRAYRGDGTLADRSLAGSRLDGPDAASQAVRLATEGEVETLEGTALKLNVRSICLHGDGAGAARKAEEIKAALRSAQVALRAFA